MSTADVRKILDQFAVLGKSMPKRPNLVVFTGRTGNRLMDNVKYAFLHFVRHAPEMDSRFLTFDRDEHARLQKHGLPSILFGQDSSMETLASASLIICDDLWWKVDSPAYPLLANARAIQLWHGVPLKAIGFPEIESAVNMTPEKADYLHRGYSGYDAVLSTSPFCTEHAFGRAFAAREFPELGYPRNDVMLREPDADDMLSVDAKLYGELKQFRKNGGRTLFYMPTFRDEGYDPFSCGAVNLAALSRLAERMDARIVLKLHPYINTGFAKLPERVCEVDSKSDIYPLMAQCDALLTDYSSIYFDYLLLDRPLLFYPFDFERYTTSNRALLFDYEAMTPGDKAMNPADLLRIVEAALAGEDRQAEKRRALRAKIFTHFDGKSAARLADYVRARFLAGRDAL